MPLLLYPRKGACDMSTLKELRKAAGLTQTDVSKALGFKGREWEYRERNPCKITIGNIEKLAELFNVPFDRVWDIVREEAAESIGRGV